jgi:dipeptidyl aminopeptidase/acylaminoacyl peptidase
VLRDRAAGTNRVATDAWDRSVSGLVWAADGTALYGAIDDAGHRRVYRIAVPSGDPEPVTREHSFSGLSLAREGSTLVALRQSFVEPPTLVRVNPEDGSVDKLSTFNDDVLAEVDLGTYESVTYTGANGDEIQMWINYPPGFDRSQEWPLYLLIHGGPHNAVTDSFHWRWNAQVFSGWGYVTAWHNFHGSSGFGQAFTDSINPLQSELPYEDTIRAAEYLAAKPWIDSDRMAAGGGSFGGYMAAILLGREHPFETIIAHAAVYNWYTQYAADYGAGHRRHGEFWESPEIFETSSPHFGAGNFTTPTLVIHGENDYRVPLSHGVELFNTLQKRGVKSRLIYYPDENHWVLKPNNSLHWYGAKEEWLEEFIGTGPTES